MIHRGPAQERLVYGASSSTGGNTHEEEEGNTQTFTPPAELVPPGGETAQERGLQ